MTTPPLPSSSPAPAMDVMDMSPLPHKIPFTITKDVDLQSPTPDTPMMNTGSSPLQESPLEASKGAQHE